MSDSSDGFRYVPKLLQNLQLDADPIISDEDLRELDCVVPNQRPGEVPEKPEYLERGPSNLLEIPNPERKLRFSDPALRHTDAESNDDQF